MEGALRTLPLDIDDPELEAWPLFFSKDHQVGILRAGADEAFFYVQASTLRLIDDGEQPLIESFCNPHPVRIAETFAVRLQQMTILRITRPTELHGVERFPLPDQQVGKRAIAVAFKVLRSRVHDQQPAVLTLQVDEGSPLKYLPFGSFNAQREIAKDGSRLKGRSECQPIPLLDF